MRNDSSAKPRLARENSLRIFLLAAPLLLAFTAFAEAEPICDLDDRWENIRDGERLTIRGRIVKSYGQDSDGNYTYDIADSCSEAAIGSAQPIECSGQITIAGEFDEFVSYEFFGQIAIWVTQAICE
jgi:hypothetical protein